MKKFLCLLMAMATIGCFAACGGGDKADKKCDECGVDGDITITTSDMMGADAEEILKKVVLEYEEGVELCLECAEKKYDGEEPSEEIQNTMKESVKERYPDLANLMFADE